MPRTGTESVDQRSGSNVSPKASARLHSNFPIAQPPVHHGPRGAKSDYMSRRRSEEHTSELQSLMRNSYAVFCLKKTRKNTSTKMNRTLPTKDIISIVLTNE